MSRNITTMNDKTILKKLDKLAATMDNMARLLELVCSKLFSNHDEAEEFNPNHPALINNEPLRRYLG